MVFAASASRVFIFLMRLGEFVTNPSSVTTPKALRAYLLSLFSISIVRFFPSFCSTSTDKLESGNIALILSTFSFIAPSTIRSVATSRFKNLLYVFSSACSSSSSCFASFDINNLETPLFVGVANISSIKAADFSTSFAVSSMPSISLF